jgi:hypothetical protein
MLNGLATFGLLNVALIAHAVVVQLAVRLMLNPSVEKLRHCSKHHQYPNRVCYPLAFERSGYLHPIFDDFIDLLTASTPHCPSVMIRRCFCVLRAYVSYPDPLYPPTPSLSQRAGHLSLFPSSSVILLPEIHPAQPPPTTNAHHLPQLLLLHTRKLHLCTPPSPDICLAVSLPPAIQLVMLAAPLHTCRVVPPQNSLLFFLKRLYPRPLIVGYSLLVAP